VGYSFEDAFSTLDVNVDGRLHVLSAIRERSPKTRLYFAASSEMFGKAEETPQHEGSNARMTADLARVGLARPTRSAAVRLPYRGSSRDHARTL
jgi:nucleoside-diphosphate-sugar epimerase